MQKLRKFASKNENEEIDDNSIVLNDVQNPSNI